MKTVYFKMMLDNVVANESTMRDNVQALAVSAIETYGQHGDTSRIEMLVNASIKMKSIRSQTLKEFIKYHANVKFMPVKDGVGFVVKKIGKGAIEVKEVTINWYDFDKVGVAKPDMDLLLKAKAMMAGWGKSIEEGKAKRNTFNDRLAAIIDAELAAHEAAHKAA
tara:strand:- start:827 stop:1321 length:495 start_codon:yes stop_codon:yes gene_type:complete